MALRGQLALLVNWLTLPQPFFQLNLLVETGWDSFDQLTEKFNHFNSQIDIIGEPDFTIPPTRQTNDALLFCVLVKAVVEPGACPARGEGQAPAVFSAWEARDHRTGRFVPS